MTNDVDTLATALYVKTDDLLKAAPYLAPWRRARMSTAADEPTAAAGRVSVVASIGYCAFLGGPPLIGYLGKNVTVLRALIAVAVVLALATLLTGALRPVPVHSQPGSASRPRRLLRPAPATLTGVAVTTPTAQPSPWRME